MLNLDSEAKFVHGFGCMFFLETTEENYVWSDPEYPNGDNTIKKFNGTVKQWLEVNQIPFGRSKGTHKVREYCGENVIFN